MDLGFQGLGGVHVRTHARTYVSNREARRAGSIRWARGDIHWAEAHIKIARMTLTIKLDRNWSSFQLANSTPPLSVTDSAIAPSARMPSKAPRHGPGCLANDPGPSLKVVWCEKNENDEGLFHLSCSAHKHQGMHEACTI
jgi:hypothetical protein